MHVQTVGSGLVSTGAARVALTDDPTAEQPGDTRHREPQSGKWKKCCAFHNHLLRNISTSFIRCWCQLHVRAAQNRKKKKNTVSWPLVTGPRRVDFVASSINEHVKWILEADRRQRLSLSFWNKCAPYPVATIRKSRREITLTPAISYDDGLIMGASEASLWWLSWHRLVRLVLGGGGRSAPRPEETTRCEDTSLALYGPHPPRENWKNFSD
jgi:hypothetical protein